MRKLQKHRQVPLLGIHPDLARHIMLGLLGSLVVALLGTAIGIAILIGSPFVEALPRSVGLLAAAAFLAVGYVGAVVAPRWYREATRVVAEARPVKATAAFTLDSSSDSTSLHAHLFHLGASTGAEPEDVTLLPPQWDPEPLLGPAADVAAFVHPATAAVVAIKTPHGLLWALPQWHWRRRPPNTL